MKTKVETKEFSLKAVLPSILTVALAMLLTMMDTTIMNVAIPSLQHVFSTKLSTVQWSVTGYTLALAAITPIAGWLSDRFSAKRVIFLAIVWFTIFSVLCSMSQSIEILIVFRCLQGMAGGLVGPIGMAESWKLVPADKRGSLMALLGLPMVIAPIAGPILAGWLLSYASWHAIFYINLPIGIIAAICVLKYLPKRELIKNERLDIFGALLSPTAFVTLIYGVHRLGDHALTDWTTTSILLIGITLLILFIYVELKQDHPLMALSAFKVDRFRRGILVSWLNQIVLFGATLLIPLFLQTAKGFSPLHAGEMIAPQALASFVGMFIGGQLFDRWGVRAAALPGIGLMFIGIIRLTQLTLQTDTTTLLITIAILGLGQGMTMMQISTYNLGSAPKAVVSRLTPLINSAMQIINSLAVVWLTNVLSKNLVSEAKTATAATFENHVVLAYGQTFTMLLGILALSFIVTITLNKVKK
ncbi:MDR family MFS transporter [Dellaglioa algida]|uniref:MDR family MFS transporter n=1 Tax=Dellaglioa algida TaxID=105612 RepID=UPI0024C4E2C5|nr:MDR family MFS transporter [Dellaglioa algida]MDK1726680.1 multidrug efflux MFS transporter [Dellaglioa algida]